MDILFVSKTSLLSIEACFLNKMTLQRRRWHATRAREAADERVHGVRAGDEAAAVGAATLTAQRGAQQVPRLHVEVSIYVPNDKANGLPVGK